MPPIATVIIPHHNDAGRLAECLKSLAQCHTSEQIEIIVVDNGQPALPASFAQQHPDVTLLYTPTPSAALARNLGVAQAQGHILIFTDSDCKVAPNFLAEAIAAATQNDVTGGQVALSPHSPNAPNSIEAFELAFAFNQRHYTQRLGFSVTANMVTTSTVFRHVGAFRATLSEDYDWGRRATALGYQTVYAPDLVVHHPCRATWPDLRRKWQRITAETYATHKSGHRSNTLWVLRAALMPLSIFAHAPKAIFTGALPTPRARLGALVTLARIRIWRMVEMIRITTRQKPAEPDPIQSLWLKPQPAPPRRE